MMRSSAVPEPSPEDVERAAKAFWEAANPGRDWEANTREKTKHRVRLQAMAALASFPQSRPVMDDQSVEQLAEVMFDADYPNGAARDETGDPIAFPDDPYYERHAQAALNWMAERISDALSGGFSQTPAVIDAAHIEHQREWSRKMFGPQTSRGVADHIRKELIEAEDDPTEWFDVILLAIDGACRDGLGSQEIIDGVKAKQAVNEAREWPDWRTLSPDQAVEHVRGEDKVEVRVPRNGALDDIYRVRRAPRDPAIPVNLCDPNEVLDDEALRSRDQRIANAHVGIRSSPAPQKVDDLLAALEASVAAAKEARKHHPRPIERDGGSDNG